MRNEIIELVFAKLAGKEKWPTCYNKNRILWICSYGELMKIKWPLSRMIFTFYFKWII